MGYSIDDKMVNFLTRSQNPDGGWGWVSFYSLKHTLPYRFLASRIESFQDLLRKSGTAMYWRSDFDSTVDITSRVLITLANVPQDSEEKKKSISNGIIYLMRHYKDGRFHKHLRWTDSDVYETSMALVALSLNNAGYGIKAGVLAWLLSCHDLSGEELAHLIWACLTAGAPRETIMAIVDRLLTIQRDDGSWPAKAPFKTTAWYLDPLFSTAVPLMALKMIDRGF
jgi:hypothetical protein